MKPILIYGSTDFGRIVRDLLEVCGREFAGYIDDFYTGDLVQGDYVRAKERFSPQDYALVIAIGYKHMKARWEVFERVCNDGYETPTLIHPRAYARTPERIGAGSLLMAGAIVEFGAETGSLCVLWNGANISHDAKVGSNVFLSPGATLCGFSEVGENGFVGAGAIITDHMRVPPWSFVRAGRVFSPSTQRDPDVLRPILP